MENEIHAFPHIKFNRDGRHVLGLICFLSMLTTLCVPSCPPSERKRSICRNSYYILIFGREIVCFKCCIHYIYSPSKESMIHFQKAGETGPNPFLRE